MHCTVDPELKIDLGGTRLRALHIPGSIAFPSLDPPWSRRLYPRPRPNQCSFHDTPSLNERSQHLIPLSYRRFLSTLYLFGYVQDAQDEKHALERLESATDEAKALSENGQLAEARKRMRQAMRENSRMFGCEDRKIVVAEHLYALVLFSQGRYKKAAKKQERLMSLLKKEYRKDDGDTLEVAGGARPDMARTGKMNRSKALAIKLLRRNEREFGKDSTQSLNTQETLAKISYLEGNLSEAAEIRYRILRYAISRDEKPPKKAKAHHTYGITLMAQGKLDDSNTYLLHAVDLSMKAVGPNHPTTLTYQSDVALLHDRLGEYQTAIQIEIKVLEERASVLGEGHPSTIETMGKRATFLFHDGQDKRSEEQLDRAVGLLKRRREAYDAGLGTVLANAACISRSIGRYTTARELSCQAYDVMKRCEGEESPSTLSVMTQYSLCPMNEAQETMKRCVQHTKPGHGTCHQLTMKRVRELEHMHKGCVE